MTITPVDRLTILGGRPIFVSMATTRTTRKKVYKIVFLNEGKVYEIYAKNISHGELFGFVAVEGLLFGEKSTLVIDPSEESLQHEFAGVERTYIPLHSVVRIDEVAKRGVSKIYPAPASKGKVTQLPTPMYTPPKAET